MCGIAVIAGPSASSELLEQMLASQQHRGPDDRGVYLDERAGIGLGHVRLSIIDLTSAGKQPMCSPDARVHITYNGEIYNYLELRAELADYPFRTDTDTEVLLAAYLQWGEQMLDRLVGMFAFAIWDERDDSLLLVRDRFGVKPLHYAEAADGSFVAASETGALHAAGVPAAADPGTWATYLAYGLHDHTDRSFWAGIYSLPAGCCLRWRNGTRTIRRWYDLPERIGAELAQEDDSTAIEQYRELLLQSIRWRFRADVPVGINLSGGLDSSMLLGLVAAAFDDRRSLETYTFTTGDTRYDELPWVQGMLDHTPHTSVVCQLSASAVADLARRVMVAEGAPYGGLPSIAYANLFATARERGVLVLLDGQGMDEQFAGYDYYARAVSTELAPLQGSKQPATRRECMSPELTELAVPLQVPARFDDALRARQYLDAFHTKIPRALRFNDRVSMMSSTELREPFLDHRLFEFAFRQPAHRKIRDGVHKWLPRRLVKELLPERVTEAPKRPLQTPQREWLRGPLRHWVTDHVEAGLEAYPEWFDAGSVRRELATYFDGGYDNSFFVWQWLSLGLWHRTLVSP